MNKDYLKAKLERWIKLLSVDGKNTKNMVKNDMIYLLNIIKDDEKINKEAKQHIYTDTDSVKEVKK